MTEWRGFVKRERVAFKKPSLSVMPVMATSQIRVITQLPGSGDEGQRC